MMALPSRDIFLEKFPTKTNIINECFDKVDKLEVLDDKIEMINDLIFKISGYMAKKRPTLDVEQPNVANPCVGCD